MSSLGSGFSALLPSDISSHLKLSCPAPKRLLRALGAMVAVCLLGSGLAHAIVLSNTWTVNTTADDTTGVAADCAPGSSTSCTLRDAITAANADSGDTIEFTVTGTITLTSALPAITSYVNITGPGASSLTMSGANAYQVFSIASGSSATISGLTIANGAAAQIFIGYCGGGVYVDQAGTLKLSSSNVNGNYSSGFGGGICNYGGTLTVTGSSISGNAAGYYSDGGGIFNTGTLTMTNSSVTGNTAGYGDGGGIENYYGTLTLTNSTVAGNTSANEGGGIYSYGTLTVTNSTVAGNTSANEGGGIYNYETLTVNNSTFTGNNAAYRGGGIENGDGSVLTLANNIISGNTVAGSPDDFDDDSTNGLSTNAGGNVVGYYNGDTVNTTPINMAPLGNYGGPTHTMLPQPGSAAICAGLASNVPSVVTTDQRGWPMTPSTCPSGYVDAGSVQTNYWTINTLADSPNTVDATSCTDGTESATNTCSLRDAISQANTAGYADVAFAPSLFVSKSAAATPGTITLGLGSAGDIPLPQVTGTLNLWGPGANLLTVSGDGDASVDTILFVNPGATANLWGLTIANGQSNGNAGGIDNQGSLSLSGAALTNNQGSNWGGGIYNEGGATLTVSNSNFTGNSAQGGGWASGGGIANSGKLTVNTSTFSGNKVNAVDSDGEAVGGAIGSFGLTTVNTSTFSGNNVLGVYGVGGAIGGFGLTVNSSTIVGNASAWQGGGIYNFNGNTLMLTNSIVAGNTASGIADNCDLCGTQSNSNLIGLPKGITNINQILGSLALSPATAAVPVMLPRPGVTSIICQGSASLLPAGVTADERGFPMDPNCLGTVDLGAAQTNYVLIGGIVFQVPNGVAGQTLTPSPSIQVREVNALTGAVDGAGGIPVMWWLTGYGSPYTGSPLSPSHAIETTKVTKTAAGVDNLATLSGLKVNTAGTYTMTALTNSGRQQESNSFIIDDATVTQLVFTKPPASTISAGAGQPVVRVALESVDGVTITSATDSITLNVTGPGGYSNSYPPVAAVNGVATFSPAVLTVAGTYTYQAYLTANNAVTSNSVTQDVAGVAPVRIVVNDYPPIWYAGVPANATVSVLDKFGNLSPIVVTATISTNDPKATINPDQLTISGSTQVSVTFASLGTHSITATSPNLVVVPETKIVIQAPPKFVVNTSGDSGAGASDCTANPTGTGAGVCTLRDALAAAQNYGAGTITFDPTVFAAANGTETNTITLANGQLNVPPYTTISGLTTGSGATLQNLVTVDGNDQSTVFWYAPSPSTATATIANLNIDHGMTGNAGAGIYNNGTMTVAGDTLSGNTAPDEVGGGIFNYGTMTVTNSVFSGNSAGYGAGINNQGTITVAGCTFSGNTASGWGGGMDSFGPATVAGSTFTGNSAYVGGGIANDGGALTVTGSTISGNTAPGGWGGGIYNEGSPSVTAVNSIISGNSDSGGADDVYDAPYSGAITTFAGGNVLGYYNGNAINTTAINLAPLANYGGSIQTMIPLPGSPAICAGLVANIPAGVTKDERGLPNTNSTYPGYASSACVDSGAVQTHYSMALTVSKSLSAILGSAMTPAPIVTLSESGKAAPYGAGTVNMVDANGTLDGQSTSSAALNAGSATFSNLVIDAIGSDSLTVSLALNPAVTPAMSLSQTSAPFTVAGEKQTISISVAPTGTQYAGKSATLSATDSSNQGATFTTTSSNCNISGNTVNYTAGGNCVVNASVPGNSQYAAATATKTITVALNPQTITFTVAPSGTQYAGKTATLSGTSTSGETPTFSTTSTNCSVEGTTVNYTAIGSCVISASVPANSMYAAATASKTITVALAPQTITFTLPTAQQHVGGSATQGATAGASTFVAEASSGLLVTLNSLTNTCAVTGTPGSYTISYSATGTCTLAANQGGDQIVWAAAPTALKSITIAK